MRIHPCEGSIHGKIMEKILNFYQKQSPVQPNLRKGE